MRGLGAMTAGGAPDRRPGAERAEGRPRPSALGRGPRPPRRRRARRPRSPANGPTSPCRRARRAQGTIHPVSQVMDEIAAIFADLGFAVAEGPQIESDWYNFDALNIPAEHPARQDHDTFYMARAGGDNRPPHVLRTHTSPVQIRAHRGARRPLPDHRARPGLSRRLRPDPHPDVPPGRGAGHRPRHLDGEPEMGARGVLPRLLRGRRRRAQVPRLALPLHRALGRGRHPLLLGRRPAQDRRGRRLARDPRLRHGAPQGARRRRRRPRRSGRASPSAWASTGWRCSSTASPTSAPSSTATCAGSATTASSRSTCRRCRAGISR